MHNDKNNQQQIKNQNIDFKQKRQEFEQKMYKKITKKDFVFALMFSFIFVFTIFYSQNSENFKADLFNTSEENIIYDGETGRQVEPTLSFSPSNDIINNGILQKDGKTYLNYYVLDNDNQNIDIAIDNITSKPTCPYGRRYKFQGTTQYLKLGEVVNEANLENNTVNYPVLTKQPGINANYKINESGTGITIYFDKDIKNGKYYDFALKDGITFYSDYNTLTKFTPQNLQFQIHQNELVLTFNNLFKVDFGRIIIDDNLISDLDGRINDKNLVVGDTIGGEILIDNKKPQFISKTYDATNKILKIFFDENIMENPNKNFLELLTTNGTITDFDITQNQIDIYGAESNSFTLGIGAVIDKNGNENNSISSN
ncbi:hypothetical protein LR002_02330 [Candidatus Gracilibacteria bacterium]|nr:hypothetical protein [Candidatus Gracilibacteria bacterium]